VYENKETIDKMTDKISDIFGNLMGILQDFPAFEGHFAGICAFDAGFGGDEQTRNFQIPARFH
jgi:hypothetical protein